MGKKGKGNKLAKMSEEERARYLQLRADIEEEARRRKMQLIMLYMKNKLKREEAFCRLNMAKINQEWRSILRQIKCDDLRKEMLEVEKFFKEALDAKEHTIKRLLDNLEVADDMYATLQQTHMIAVDRLIAKQQERVEFYKDIFEKNKTTVLKHFQDAFDDFKQLRDNGREQMECVSYQLDDKGKKMALEKYERQMQRVDYIQCAMQIRLEEITRKGEAQLERLWKEYQEVLNSYVSYTEGFFAEYTDLKERDEEHTAIIRDHCYEIQKSTDLLAHLKLVYLDTMERNEVKVNYLTKVRNDLHARFVDLKQKVDREIMEDEERFKLMSVKSHFALKFLDKTVSAGETLLQLTTVCRKYETEREKLLPMGLPPLPRLMLESSEQTLHEPPSELKQKVFSKWRKMENFWRRVNNASTDVLSLVQSKKRLAAVNASLKAELQDYLINLNISSGSNSHINEYLAKRPHSMRVERVSSLDHAQQSKTQSANASRRPLTTCLEANLTNAVRSRRLIRNKPKLAKIVSIVNW